MNSVVVVISGADPVADAVAKAWGTLPASDGHVDGAPVRRLNETMVVLRRTGSHVHDERVDLLLPRALRVERPTLVFPSIHRSRENVRSLTVHPLGNPGPRADLGGRPRTLVPTDPRRMVSALRLLIERGEQAGIPATYEATHHGPEVGLPAFFIEIGSGDHTDPAPEAVRILADVIPRLDMPRGDRVALGVGGGHYVPHFTDLASHRRWAFGHLLSRHSLEGLDRDTALQAYRLTEDAEGIVFSRAQDSTHPAFESVGPRLRDQDAPLIPRGVDATATDADRSASGT